MLEVSGGGCVVLVCGSCAASLVAGNLYGRGPGPVQSPEDVAISHVHSQHWWLEKRESERPTPK